MILTIKTVDGTTLGTSTEITSIDRLTVNKTTNSDAYVLGENTTTGDSITVNFPIDSTKTFLGLIISPISSIDYGYPVGSTTDVSYSGDTSLWVLYDSATPEVSIDVFIKNASGTTLASSQGISEISTIGIISSAESTQKTVTLTDVNGEVITLSWNSVEEGKTFRGLGFTPIETTTPTYPTNSGELDASWTTNTTLYEVWTTDDPPEPDPEPEPEPEPDPTTFDINLYYNTAEINRLDKSDYLTSAGTLSGTLRDECSLISPIITFYSESVPSFNYVYISQFSRYYYVVGMSSINKNVWRMELSCDVLMTYRTQIYSCGGVVTRSASLIDSGVIDNEVAFDTETQYKKIDLGEIMYQHPETEGWSSLFINSAVTVEAPYITLNVVS